MCIRLGINPIGWTNDCMPWLGDFISLDTCLKEAKAAGFSGVELGRKFPRDPAVLGPILKPHGLNLVSGWYSGRLVERSVAAAGFDADFQREAIDTDQHAQHHRALGTTRHFRTWVGRRGRLDIAQRSDGDRALRHRAHVRCPSIVG